MDVDGMSGHRFQTKQYDFEEVHALKKHFIDTYSSKYKML